MSAPDGARPRNEETRAADLCWNCHDDPGRGHFCRNCSKIQPLQDGRTDFEILGLPRHLCLDAGSIERQYHELARKFHPDYFRTASPLEREISQGVASALNTAYRKIRDPIKRIETLLLIEGVNVESMKKRIPPHLMDDLFRIREEVDLVRRGGGTPENSERLKRDRKKLAALLAGQEETLKALSGEWDAIAETDGEKLPSAAGGVLDRLASALSEQMYLQTTLREIDGALETAA
ncbi:MAG: hypothetical protein HY039_02455 [Nitrospirae bacterium]|nr:hypothetical protein [Nitrospirota bacterium]